MSGYITPSTYPSNFGRAVRLYYEERNVNQEANTSDIYWELQGYNRTADSTGYYWAGPFNVTINGTKVVNNLYPSGSRIQLRSDTVVAKGTLANVAHNADGTMSVEASFFCDYIYDGSNKASGSGTITLTTIPRASTVTAQDGVFGQPWTYTVNNPAAFYTRVTLTIGSHTYTHTYSSEVTPIADFTAAQTRTWADSCPDSDSATMTIRVETMRDEPTQGVPVEIIGDTTQTVTFSVPTSWAPTFPVPTRATGVNTYNGLTLRNLSSAQIRITATATTGASLTSIKIMGPGINQTVNNPSTLTTVTTGLLTQSGDLTWTITATDSRGRQGTWKSQALTVTPYRLPAGTLTVHRCDADGTANNLGAYMTATLTATIDTSISGNEGAAEVKLGSTSIGSTSGETAAFTLTTSPSAASTTSTYTVSATVTDSAGGSVTITTKLSTAQVLMDFKAGGDGVAFGGSATESNVVAIKGGWKLKIDTPLDVAYGGTGASGVTQTTWSTDMTVTYSDGTSPTVDGKNARMDKLGPLVHIYGYFRITNLGTTGSKNLVIGGLPVTIKVPLSGTGTPFMMAAAPSDGIPLIVQVTSGGQSLTVIRGPQAGNSRATLVTGWCSFDLWAFAA